MNAEHLTQLSHVMPIALARLIPLMKVNLLLSRQARYRPTIDDAHDEALGRVDEGLVRLRGGLPRAPISLENQGMQIDLTAVFVCVDEPDRPPIEGFGEPSGDEGIEDPLFLLLPVHQVKIAMITRLPPDQRVNAPPTSNPHLKAVQQLQHTKNILAIHPESMPQDTLDKISFPDDYHCRGVDR